MWKTLELDQALMNPALTALIFEARHKNYVKLQSKDFAKTKMKKCHRKKSEKSQKTTNRHLNML